MGPQGAGPSLCFSAKLCFLRYFICFPAGFNFFLFFFFLCARFENYRAFLFFLCSLSLAALGPHCCMLALSSCGERGPLSSCAWAARSCGFPCCRAQALGHVGSIVVHGFRCLMACGIFLDQGSNPCPLHWQADS